MEGGGSEGEMEKERKRKRERDKERKRERERERDIRLLKDEFSPCFELYNYILSLLSVTRFLPMNFSKVSSADI